MTASLESWQWLLKEVTSHRYYFCYKPENVLPMDADESCDLKQNSQECKILMHSVKPAMLQNKISYALLCI